MRPKDKKMNAPSQKKIALEVLRVASPDVLGQSTPLSISNPFCFSNAKGDLKKVDSFEEIQKIAEESTRNFMANIGAAN